MYFNSDSHPGGYSNFNNSGGYSNSYSNSYHPGYSNSGGYSNQGYSAGSGGYSNPPPYPAPVAFGGGAPIPFPADGGATNGTGVVKRWLSEKGFGFVIPDGGGADVYVHRSGLSGIEDLSTGDKVRFTLVDDGKGRGKFKAVEVVVTESCLKSGSNSVYADLPAPAPEDSDNRPLVGLELFFEYCGIEPYSQYSYAVRDAISNFLLMSSFNCPFLVVSERQLVESIRAPNFEEYERIYRLVELYISACESRKAVMLVDFEGEMPGYGGELTTAQLQITFTIDGATLMPRSLPMNRLFQAPGLLMDLRYARTAGLLRRVMQSSSITKLLWGADGDCQSLMYQTLPVPLQVDPKAVVDVQLGFDTKFRVGMAAMLEHVNQDLLTGLPMKEQIDWDAFHSKHQRALPLPLGHSSAMYAVDDLHRMEAIVGSKAPPTGSYMRARDAMEQMLVGLRADPFGLQVLHQEMVWFERKQGIKRTVKAVQLARHVYWVRATLASQGGQLTSGEQSHLNHIEGVAQAELGRAGVVVSSDLSFNAYVPERKRVSSPEKSSEESPFKPVKGSEKFVSAPRVIAPPKRDSPDREKKGKDVVISKAMSMVLRHNAVDLGIEIQNDGFCDVNDVLRLVRETEKMDVTFEDLERVVRTCPKKRFELKKEAANYMVRATQGHSMSDVEDTKLMTALNAEDPALPVTCVHGTYLRNFEDIFRFGLIAGGPCQNVRKHIHFTASDASMKIQSGTQSGMRDSCDLALWVDLPAALKDGIRFYRSRNGVILSPGIDGILPSKYIVKAKDLKTNREGKPEWLDISRDFGANDSDAFDAWKLEKLKLTVNEQVEFYFSPDNYVKDDFLKSCADQDGWISLKIVAGLNRLTKLGVGSDLEFIRDCLESGTSFKVSNDGKYIRQVSRI